MSTADLYERQFTRNFWFPLIRILMSVLNSVFKPIKRNPTCPGIVI